MPCHARQAEGVEMKKRGKILKICKVFFTRRRKIGKRSYNDEEKKTTALVLY